MERYEFKAKGFDVDGEEYIFSEFVDILSDEERDYLIKNPKGARKYLLKGLIEENFDETPLKKVELNKVVLFLAELQGLYPSLNEKQLTPTNADLINELATLPGYKKYTMKKIERVVKEFNLETYELTGTILFNAIISEITKKGDLWKSVCEKQEKTTSIVNTEENRETPEYIKWRKEVLDRDQVCKCCGVNVNLQAHHLFGYKENPTLQLDENNGVTLCKWCHEKYHSLYGVKSINPIDFIDFIKKYGV